MKKSEDYTSTFVSRGFLFNFLFLLLKTTLTPFIDFFYYMGSLSKTIFLDLISNYYSLESKSIFFPFG